MLVGLGHEGAVVELGEEFSELRESLVAELVFELGLDLTDRLPDGPSDGLAPFGEVDALRASIVGIVDPHEIPGPFELSEEIVHRLLAHPDLGSKV